MKHIAERYPDSRISGLFSLGDEKDVFGELKLKGRNTSLELRHAAHVSTHKITDKCVTGVLHDLSRVTLIECLSDGSGTYSRYNEGYATATLSPQYVAFGGVHIHPNDPVVGSVAFTIDDACTLFHDHHAFGTVLKADDFIEQIVRSSKHDPQTELGPHPIIAYFTGKQEILRVSTCIGTVTAHHCPRYGLGSSEGVRIDNTIRIGLEFNTPSTFGHAVRQVYPLFRFFEIIVGRPQNLLSLSMELPELDDKPNVLDVYCSYPYQRDASHERRKPHHMDLLLSPVRQQGSFARVLGNWLEQDKARRSARFRFSQAFGLQHSYPIDRTIAAANMFDLLPDDAVPSRVEVPHDIRDAKNKCREIFRKLPGSLERQALLEAIGRIGKSGLKHKVRHRAKPILEAAGVHFPDLNIAIDQAIDCRNYFVHGSQKSIDYSEHFAVVVFLTDTLEFIFGASDLIDAGWDVTAWLSHQNFQSHPFSSYLFTYEENISKLRGILASPAS